MLAVIWSKFNKNLEYLIVVEMTAVADKVFSRTDLITFDQKAFHRMPANN